MEPKPSLFFSHNLDIIEHKLSSRETIPVNSLIPAPYLQGVRIWRRWAGLSYTTKNHQIKLCLCAPLFRRVGLLLLTFSIGTSREIQCTSEDPYSIELRTGRCLLVGLLQNSPCAASKEMTMEMCSSCQSKWPENGNDCAQGGRRIQIGKRFSVLVHWLSTVDTVLYITVTLV